MFQAVLAELVLRPPFQSVRSEHKGVTLLSIPCYGIYYLVIKDDYVEVRSGLHTINTMPRTA